jgi:hypothetical protein
VLILLLELPRLKALWKSLIKTMSSSKPGNPHTLKPKSEKDCPHCEKGHAQTLASPETVLVPYDQTKGKGGRKKKICCAGYLVHPPWFY